MMYFPSDGYFYLAHWYVSRQELSSQLLWLIPQGTNDRCHHEKCPSFPVCPGIQSKEQKLIFMVCLSDWAIFPFLGWLRHNSISTNNMHRPLWNSDDVWYDGLWATSSHFFTLLATFALFAQAVRCSGQGMSKRCLALPVRVHSQLDPGELLQSI